MQNHEQIERRTFVGETATQAFDGFAGFRIGQSYQLRYTREFDEVRIELDHVPRGQGQPPLAPMVVSTTQFNTWWEKA